MFSVPQRNKTLWFTVWRYENRGGIKVVGYTDSDWAADAETRKSISGHVITINGTPIKWKSKKQPILAQSTFEAELVALCLVVQEINYLKAVLKFVKIPYKKPIKVYCDNQSVIKGFKEGYVTKKTRHIDVRFHKIKNCKETGKLKIEYIPSEENKADQFTKHFTTTKFCELTNELMDTRTLVK